MLNMNDREEVAKYDRLKKSYDDPTFEVVSGVFRALSGRKIIGAGSFQRSVHKSGIVRAILVTEAVRTAAPATQGSKRT